jgi:hypothetical protein
MPTFQVNCSRSDPRRVASIRGIASDEVIDPWNIFWRRRVGMLLPRRQSNDGGRYRIDLLGGQTHGETFLTASVSLREHVRHDPRFENHTDSRRCVSSDEGGLLSYRAIGSSDVFRPTSQ